MDIKKIILFFIVSIGNPFAAFLYVMFVISAGLLGGGEFIDGILICTREMV